VKILRRKNDPTRDGEERTFQLTMIRANYGIGCDPRFKALKSSKPRTIPSLWMCLASAST
jgi:hypothetical protein